MTDFIAIYSQWSQTTSDPTVRNFLGWLGENCEVTAGDVMTDTEFQRICELSGTDPDEAEDALMESAWP